MKRLLLLSSVRFLINNPGIFEKYFGQSLKDFKMAYVINATKGVEDLEYFHRNQKYFQEQGCEFTLIDLDEYTEEQLREKLSQFGLVYVEGGNTFGLLKSIRNSGFDKVVKELLPQGLIYMGGSAGSYVACPNIEMSTWKERSNYDYHGITEYTAMGLVPFSLWVHYEPEQHDWLLEKSKNSSLPMRILTDDQALVVRDTEVELIGDSQEVKL